MHILLIHQYFKTPEDGGGIRSYHIARYLAEKGHQVEVITAHNTTNSYIVDQAGNFKVHYLPIYYSNHLSFFSRIHAFFRFVWQAIGVIKKIKTVDLNYVMTTPLTTGIIALYARKKLGIPYIFDVGDLWPDAPVQLGVLNNILAKKIAYMLERASYSNAKKIVALSTDIAKHIKTKCDTPVEVITNVADIDYFQPTKKNAVIASRYGVENKFVVAYTGTIGMANHLEYLIEIADKSKNRNDLFFVVMGNGARISAIKDLTKKRGLDNLLFLKPGSKGEVKEILSISDAIYISFKKVPVLATGSPNKFFDGLAAGKLIIINFEGWIREKIEEHQCGFYYDPLNPDSFIEKIIPYLVDGRLLKESQENARRLAEDQFALQKELRKLDNVIQ